MNWVDDFLLFEVVMVRKVDGFDEAWEIAGHSCVIWSVIAFSKHQLLSCDVELGVLVWLPALRLLFFGYS